MNESADRLQWFRNAYRKYAEDIKDVADWEFLEHAAIYRKHTGDLDGAIDAMVKAIGLTRAIPNLAEETATMLNYLAGDLYLPKGAADFAEEAIREAIEISRPRFPGLLAANLWILAGIQTRKGENHEALASAEEARLLYQQQGHSHGVAQAEQLIATIKSDLE